MVDLAQLAAPFPPAEIDWRVGSTTQDKKKGMALAYIDARTVMDRLDAVCGPGGWQCRYPHAGAKTCCEIGIKVGEDWVWRSDGAGDTDFEGDKGAFSDAFKRAAVRFGIGRYLYGLGSPWVEIEPMGKSFKIKESELPKLRALLAKGAAAPATAAKQPEADAPVDEARERAWKWAGWLTKKALSLDDPGAIDDLLAEKKANLAELKQYQPDLYETAIKTITDYHVTLTAKAA